MFSADLGGYTAPLPAATDPPFQKVALLLHGDGTNGAQNNTFVDGSTNNFTITRTGNVAQGTFSPFSLAEGQWSNYFDGTGDYLRSSLDSVNIRSAFTIEAYCYIPTRTNFVLFSGSLTSSAGGALYLQEAGGTVYLGDSSTNNITFSSSLLPLNQWFHCACTFDGTTYRVFVNGSSVGTSTTLLQNYTLLSTDIGARNNASVYTTGYISNFRLVKGTAVYTTNFTPPTAPLTAISGTSLLTCQSNRFVDNSSNNFTITPAGDAKVTAFSPFAPSAAYSASTNGGSGYFDGSGDYLSCGTVTLGTGDYTCEGWFYSTVDEKGIFSINQSSLSSIGLLLRSSFSGGYQVFFNGSYTNVTATLPYNQWVHFALVRSSGTFKFYINGVSLLTSTDSANYPSYTIYAGFGYSSSYVLNGYLSNFRVTTSAVYTSNFTPPTAPLTAVTNTQLLLNCTNAGIIDNAGKNDIETVGNTQISTSVKKYGTGSMYFDGTGDYLKMPSNEALKRDGDFTVEAWVYPTSVSSDRAVAGMYVSGVGGWVFYISGGYLWLSSGFNNYSSTGVCVSANKWQHIAAVISNGNLYLFVDGVQKNTTTNVSASNWSILRPLVVGSADNGSIWPFIGYIDDLRITKGQALYTSNFTPPTQAFPDV